MHDFHDMLANVSVTSGASITYGKGKRYIGGDVTYLIILIILIYSFRVEISNDNGIS